MSVKGFFGRFGIGDGVDNGGFGGTSIPTLPQTIDRVGRWIGGLFDGGNQPLMNTANQFLTGNFPSQPSNANPVFQPIDLSYGQSQQQAPDTSQAPLPGLGSPMGGYGPRSPGAAHLGYSGDTASGARGTIGMGVGQASMSDVEAMLSSGAGRGRNFGSQAMPFHEINEERREAKAAGMTLQQYRAALGKPGSGL